MCAAFNGRIDTVRVLLAKGADVNAKAIMGDTALAQAKKKGHEEIVRMLKEAGTKE
jgi:ankyrin repeat protein